MSRARDIANLQSSKITADAGIDIDNINIDGTEIDLSSGDLTVDVAGNITLNADGRAIIFADDTVSFGHIQNLSGGMIVECLQQDKDIYFYGNDGGSSVLALTLDMSEAGAATFGSNVGLGSAPIANYKMTIKETSSENAAIIFTDTDDMVGGFCGMARGNDQIVDGATNVDFVVGSSYTTDTHLIANDAIGLTLANGGNVGIGCHPSGARLHVDTAVAGYAGKFINDNTATDANGILIQAGSAATEYALNVASTDGNTSFMTVKGNGRVGIGTSSPSTQTHLAKAATTAFSADNASWHDLLISNYGSATSNNVAGIAFQVSADGYASNAGTGICAVKNGTASDYGADLAFITRPQSAVAAERMRIGSTGRVSIGTASPVSPATHNARLAIEGTDYHSSTVSISANSNNGNGAYLMFSKSRGTSVGATTVVQDGDTMGYLGFCAADGIDVASVGAAIYAQVDGSPGNDDTPGRLFFATTADDANGVTNRMLIDSDGFVVIGKSSASATTTGVEFGPAGDVTATKSSGNTYYLHDTSANKFYVNANGGIYNYQSNDSNLSDEREKKNITSLGSKWNAVKKWALKEFHYNADADSDSKKCGVIAQDIEDDHPELVTEFDLTDTDKRKAVKEQQMTWMAIKALQEAMAKIETLEAEVTKLKGE